METPEELTTLLERTTAVDFRGRLQARGQARALIRQEGILPVGSPRFSETIETDLAEYGFSLLRASLALREAGGEPEIWRRGFVRAGNAFESLVQNGSPEAISRGFFRVIGAASYHLASYSALAFSLISQGPDSRNLAPIEEALVSLISRDLTTLGARARAWLLDPIHSDESLARAVSEKEIEPDDVVMVVVTSTVFRAFSFFEFALQTGTDVLVEEARGLLRKTLSLAKNANAVSLWWIVRIAFNLIDDLWSSSLHRTLPLEGPPDATDYQELRRLFIGELYSRKTAEIELWPSQIQAAQRAVDISDDLVVALPTSAGKTRIAEIATLMALACGRRVLIITPLRALSAQTERTFRKTFSTLGFTVSALYGASGMAGDDKNSLRTQDIVIATPEKLDFALRNDPTVIDDVGLVVLDEGHLIGPSEREIRYENLVQRLLRRTDHVDRRIVCLSAILPEGAQLDDLTAWIRSDEVGAPIQLDWRPTRQRFGTLVWQSQSARLSFDLETDGPFIQHFVSEKSPTDRRRKMFPKDNKELTLAAAWKFFNQGKRTLIFCTQRNTVKSFAETVVDLNQRKLLPGLLDDTHLVQRAMIIGQEWLGADHPAVLCLPIGVAIHHGRLPKPFLREVEALLAAGVVRVTVASPTLAQGLNLNAAIVLVPSLYRAGTLIPGEEFANVAGRAGRAYVDLEGLVVHVIHDPKPWRLNTWHSMVNSAKARSLESGIISVVARVMSRLARTEVFGRKDAMEYLANTQEAWFPPDEPDVTESIESLIERLDATVLGLIEALDDDSADLPRLLDEALTGSLWDRQMARIATRHKRRQLRILEARARLIWNKSTSVQRQSQFAMGVGLESGLSIEAIAVELTALLDQADIAALQGNADVLGDALIDLAERFFSIRPFIPEEDLTGNWPHLLRTWIKGDDVADIGLDNMRIVEEAFVYRLVWAIEALRMHRRVNGDESEYLEGSAAACLETGLPQITMAMLVRAGLPSRIAARTIITQIKPIFTTRGEMIQWLRSDEMRVRLAQQDWPTPETHEIWNRFCNETLAGFDKKWFTQTWNVRLTASADFNPAIPGRIAIDPSDGQVSITTPDYRPLHQIPYRLQQLQPSHLHVSFAPDGLSACITRMGRGEASLILPR